MPATKSKSENKSKPEVVKPTKTLSPKRQLEADHLAGKHSETSFGDCGFCNRRSLRDMKKAAATKRFFANKK